MKPVKYVCALGDVKYTDYVVRYERGYMSRKTEIGAETPVYRSGDGRLFYYSPCGYSTQYKLRIYLVRNDYYVRENA